MSERKINEWALPHVRKFETYIDIGADTGTTSVPFLEKFKKVIAFEPNPVSFQELSKNLQIESYNIALSNFIGETNLTIPVGGKNQWGTITKERIAIWEEIITIPVSVTTLDSYHFENVDFIKIDVEQGEYEVIIGALGTIKKCKPVIIFENKRNEGDRVIPILESVGYKIKKYKSDTVAYWEETL